MTRKYSKSLIISILLALLLAGCGSKDSNTETTTIDPDTPVTLKVAYMNEQAFFQTYGNIFTAKYPNVQFEVIPTMNAAQSADPMQALIDLIDANQPDIIMLSLTQYEQLAADGRLYDLESVIQQSGFDLNNMVDGVLQLLRDAGGGKLYGLSPTFNTDALFYNKDLFAKYGIPEPTDFMTWEEVLQLAARFPTDGDDETRIYGLAGSIFAQNAFELIQDIASAKGLNYLNAEATELMMNEPEWKEIFLSVVEGYKSKTISLPVATQGGGNGGGMRFNRDSIYFLQGRAAMVVDSSITINMMNMGTGRGGGGGAGAGTQQQLQQINWGVVTAPVDAATPDMTSTYTVSQIFAVSAASSQTSMAWEFIKYVHSEEAAKIRSNTSTELQSRTGYEVNANGVNLEAFYKLNPMTMESTHWYPKGFRSSFNAIADEEINAAVSEAKTIDDAFASLLSRGADALAEANLSGEKEQEGAGFGVQGIFISR
ncbi:ABC transporter substrate-binding protein [Paenibacillus tarimensis]